MSAMQYIGQLAECITALFRGFTIANTSLFAILTSTLFMATIVRIMKGRAENG